MRDFELSPDDATAQRRLIRLRAEQDALSRGELELDTDQRRSTAPARARCLRGSPLTDGDQATIAPDTVPPKQDGDTTCSMASRPR